MNKFKAKKYLNILANDNEDRAFSCKNCLLGCSNFITKQSDIYSFLNSYKLYDISTCSSRFLYICLNYKPKQIQNIINYAKKITKDKTVFLDQGSGCPCECLSELSEYILNRKELLDIE
jgi:hypothetical protein